MKYLVFLSLFLFFSCKSSMDMGSVQNTSPFSEPIVLDLDYEGETLHAIQRDKIAEAEFKIVDPGTKIYHQNLLYSPKPGDPGLLYKNLPYNGEEIPAIHLDNSTLNKIRTTKGVIVVPKVIEDK